MKDNKICKCGASFASNRHDTCPRCRNEELKAARAARMRRVCVWPECTETLGDHPRQQYCAAHRIERERITRNAKAKERAEALKSKVAPKATPTKPAPVKPEPKPTIWSAVSIDDNRVICGCGSEWWRTHTFTMAGGTVAHLVDDRTDSPTNGRYYHACPRCGVTA